MSKRKYKNSQAIPNSKAIKKSKADEESKCDDESTVIFSDELKSNKPKWINKQRVMIIAARGIIARERHLMINLRHLLPHSKSDSKVDSKKASMFNNVNEICEMRNCNKCLFFVNKKRKDSYLWMANTIKGPSAKLLIENIHTMEELKLRGNSLKSSRPILSFDSSFDKEPHYALLKELLIQIFGTPRYHPRSQPFFDHIFTFTIFDDRIWFRNYAVNDDESLEEIGPRFCLNLIKIFDGCFSGQVLYSNKKFVNPNMQRRLIRLQAQEKFKHKVLSVKGTQIRKPKGEEYKDIDPFGDIFQISKQEKHIFRQKI